MPGNDSRSLPEGDLRHVLEHVGGLWDQLRGASLFVTGGTGFFGRWMVESFLRANDELLLGAEALILTRDPDRFGAVAPHVVNHPAVTLVRGDVRSFDFPVMECTHVLHMATETKLGESPGASFLTAVEGTSRVLAFATATGARQFLLTSSGAVYGTQPPDCGRITEDFSGGPRPDDVGASYALGKRASEFLCAVAAAETGLAVKIARCFAFVGPLLPTDSNFAIGNFIRDGLGRDRIEVSGDGTPRRAYLYAADLAVWLWTILLAGESGRPYNVGSEEDLSIREVAELVAEVLGAQLPVDVAMVPEPGVPSARYIPSTARAAADLGLRPRVPLRDAIRRTAEWYSTGPTRGR